MMILKDAPKMKVRCGVDECKYNKEHMCHANTLEINPMSNSNETHTSDETQCTTFKCS